MIEVIKEKLKTYNELNEKRGNIISEIFENSKSKLK